MAADLNSGASRDELVKILRRKGVEAGGCGDCSLRLRPSLTFSKAHADIFLQILDVALSELKK